MSSTANTLYGKEALVAAFKISPVVAKPARTAGALDGFECRCETCGLVMSSSLRTLLDADAAAHARWHERQDRAQRVFAAKVRRAGA